METSSKKENITNYELIDFLLNFKPNRDGRYFDYISNWNNFQLETCHNYIQWCFPLTEPSRYNLNCPVLSPTDFDYLKQHPEKLKYIQYNIKEMFYRMLEFYGFSYDNEKIIPKSTLRIFTWCNKNNHNFMRISRILESLCLFNLQKEANDFFQALTTLYEQKKCIGKSYQYWEKAINKETINSQI